MTEITRIIPLTIFASLGLSAFAESAKAQEIEEVVVTATKLNKNLDQLPISIAIIEGRTLEGYDGAEELTQHLSGVQAAIANGSQVAFQVRGIGAVDHQALTPTATAVYIDGVFQATNVQTSALLFDLGRVEVLKGPQGSLYGRNASAGAINFISARPEQKSSGYITGELGNFNRLNLNLAINSPINDKLAIRLAGRLLNQDSALDNIATNQNIAAPKQAGGERDEFGLRALVEYRPTEKTNLLFKTHYAEDNGINAAPLNSSFLTGENKLDKHQISVGPDGIQKTDNEFYGSSLEITHQKGNSSFFILAGYEGYNQQYGFDFDGTPAPFNLNHLNSNLSYDRDFSQYSLETRVSHERDNAELMAGLYFGSENFNQDYLIWCGQLVQNSQIGECTYVGAPGRVGDSPSSTSEVRSLLSQIEQKRKTIALFTYNNFEFSPKFNLVLGGRFTHEVINGNGEGKHIFADGTVGFNNRNNLGLAVGENKISENYLTGNIAINYTLDESTMLYASIANGFKSGGFNGEVINNATHFSDEGLFNSETVNSYEVGLKASKSNFNFNLSAFYQNYNDPQARIFVPFTLEDGGSFTSNSLSNLDSAHSYGAELSLTWMPTSGLSLGGSLTLLDTEISQKVNPSVPQNAETFDGNPLPFASEFSSTFFVEYTWQLTPKAEATIGANSKHQSSFYLDAEGREDRKQNPYGIIDAFAKLNFDNGLSVKLWAKNISNSAYAVSGFGFIGYNTFQGAPRSYGISLGLSY